MLVAGCSAQKPVAAAAPVVLTELGVVVPAPQGVPDLVYAMGEGAEGKPAALLSSRSLIAAGGRSCEAGASGAVSPFPLGQVIVADETPEQVEAERAADEEDTLGEFLAKVGDRYLYYTPAPVEACADRKGVADLQRRQAPAVKDALRRATPQP